jgi:hypothetical protein
MNCPRNQINTEMENKESENRFYIMGLNFSLANYQRNIKKLNNPQENLEIQKTIKEIKRLREDYYKFLYLGEELGLNFSAFPRQLNYLGELN